MTKKKRYEAVISYFEEAMPVAETELHYDSVFQLLVAVMLSAQCTDKRVNMVTPALFDAFPSAEPMAAAPEEDVLTSTWWRLHVGSWNALMGRCLTRWKS